MPVLKREAVQPPPDLAREEATVAGLDGAVIVTELTLDARLDFDALLREKATGAKRAVHAMVPHLLAVAVVLEDGEPLYTVAQWRAFGGRHRDAAIELFNVAMRLSGFNGDEPAKN